MKLKGLIAAPAVALLVTALSAAPVVLPEGWLLTGSAKTCRAGTEDVKGGPTAKAFVIDCPKSTEGFATVMQQFSARDYAGKRVRLSAKVQGQGLQGWGGVWMRGDSAGSGQKAMRAFDNMQTRPLLGSFDWRDVQVVLDIPSDVETMNIGFLLSAEGTLRATQFQVEVVPDSVPTTGSFKSGVAAAGPRNLTPL